MNDPALTRLAEAGEYNWAAGTTPGHVDIWYHPARQQAWRLRFFTVRATKAGRATRKSHLVVGDSLGECIVEADEICFQLRDEIAAGRKAWKENRR